MSRGSRELAGLLSVAIPSYNCAPFIAEAIRSVERQSYRPLELIVVDDGSADSSRSVIEATCHDLQIDHVHVIEQSNQGAPAAIQRGLAAASGQYLSILNCDDFYHPERFSRLVPRLGAGCSLAFSGVRFVDAIGQELPWSHGWPAWYRQALSGLETCPSVGYSLLLHNYSVTSGNFLFTREMYDHLGGFAAYRFVHDWDFLIRSVYFAEPVFVRESLISYRIHESNTTESVRDRLLDEASAALRRYVALCEAAVPPNSRAPCRHHWPSYFPRFVSESAPFFAPELRLDKFF